MEKVDVFMPFFVADYLRDTGDLSLEEHGAYVLLLIHMWGRGRLPADHARLARVVGVDAETFGRLWPGLSRFFEPDEQAPGFITQKRLAFELEEARRRKKAASDSGKKSAEVRRQQRNGNDPTNDLGNDLANETATTLPTDAQPKSNSSSPSSSSSGSSSPAPASPGSNARTRDPSATEPVAPAPAPAPDVHRRIWSAHRLLDLFAFLRSELHTNTLPWKTPTGKSREKAADFLAGLEQGHGGGDALDDIEPTMKLFLQQVRDSQDERDRDPSWLFSCWIGKFTALREQHRGMRRPAGAPKDRPCDWHEGGRNQGKPAAKSNQRPGTCAECRHLQARASPRAPSEPSSVADLVSSLMPGR